MINVRVLMVVVGMLYPTLARSGDWPQWMGPNRDGRASPESTPVTSLSSAIKPVWSRKIGGGFSSPIVSGQKLVYLDDQSSKETIQVVDVKSGTELWHISFDDSYRDEWGAGPRSTPFVDGDRLYVQSCRGEFRCLNLGSGDLLWRTSFEKDFGVKFLGSKANEGTASRRGNNGSGIIVGDDVVVPVGNTNGATLVSFHKKTGVQRWKSQNDEAAYASLNSASIAGTSQILALTADALVGVAAADGRGLWRIPLKTNAKRHAATPVVIGDSVIVNSHTFGLICFNIEKKAGGWNATEKWANKTLKINLATPVYVDGFLFGQGPARNYVCVNATTGEERWSQPGFGREFSATIATGKNLLVLTDGGELFLLAADSKRYTELGRAQVCGKTWSSPAWADGKLFVREGLLDGWKLSCFDLAK